MRPKVVLILAIFLPVVFGQTDFVVPLVVDAGCPLRVYLTKRLSKRAGAPVEAKLVEPLFAFDHEVVPAGAVVLGHVSRLENVSKMKRTTAILGGDFTPLHLAEVEFDTLVLPGGRRVTVHTRESRGLDTIVPLHPRKPPKNAPANNTAGTNNGGILGTGKQQAQAQIEAAKEKVRNMADMVRGPDKKEHLEEFLFSKLPYHPQWVLRGTRFDAELTEPLQFGTETLTSDAVRLAGSQPAPDSLAHVRLVTTLNSGDTKRGSAVLAVVTQPLYSAEHQLIFPEGTRLTGTVTVAQRARWFHRGGKLRFTFQNVELPAVAGLKAPAAGPQQLQTRENKTEATVASVESAGAGKLKVDSEGGVTATESKTRFIAPAIAAVIANRSADNDRGHVNGGNDNVGGRTLGGASGFGMLGAAAAQGSRTVGTVFGFWGMAVSVYSNIVARGSEAEFQKNAAMDVKFGARVAAKGAKFVAGGD